MLKEKIVFRRMYLLLFIKFYTYLKCFFFYIKLKAEIIEESNYVVNNKIMKYLLN